MKKILFENGKTIDGANTFNTMQDNIEEVFNGETSMGSIVVEDISCKNVLNSILFVDNKYLYYSDGVDIDSDNTKYWRTGIQKIQPNTTYYCNKNI